MNERKKEGPIYDDQTLENLRDYYKIESHDVLLKYIKKKGLVLDHGMMKQHTKRLFIIISKGFISRRFTNSGYKIKGEKQTC
jgi:hypothetical protein